jgi:hypothetical protein
MPTPTTEPKTPSTKTKTRKTIDPEILKIRRKYADEMKEYQRRRGSALILKTIITKRLPRLVQIDREKLLDTLMQNTTPGFSDIVAPVKS